MSEALLEQFEEAWRTGDPPSLEEAWSSLEDDSAEDIFFELLCIELFYLATNGLPISQATYLSRFPRHSFATEGNKVRPQGVLGRQSCGAALGDEFNVEAKLSRPGYSYLIVYCADGTNQVLYPQDDTDVPELTDTPYYPAKRRDERFVFEEGSGQWVVALIVSETPLPSYREWLVRRPNVPWHASKGKFGTVAWDDGQWIQQLEPGSSVRGSKSSPDLAPIAHLTEWLRTESSGAVQALGFTVK